MMVPRSYMRPNVLCDKPISRSPKKRTTSSQHSSRSSPNNSRSSSPSRYSNATSVLKEKTLSSLPTSQPSTAIINDVAIRSTPERTVSEPPKISQPMSIPMRRPSPQAQVNSTVQYRRSSKKSSDLHDPNALPPAVAALLAVTAIPPPRRRSVRGKVASLPRTMSADEIREEWKNDINSPSFPGSGSPLTFLLEPLDSSDGSVLGDDDAEKLAMALTSRSVSTDSILSTPSLEKDSGGFSALNSTLSTPTPSFRRALRSERRLCSPPAEEVSEHPLLKEIIPEDLEVDTIPITISRPAPSPPAKQRFKFTSNLTASLQALRSAAKAFSNFTAPSLPSDDFLTRSLFSSQRYAPEMRPKTFDSVPDPALRRYLNPTPALSSPDFHSMLSDALGARDLEPSAHEPAPMIPMQTYTRTRGSSKRRALSPERQQALEIMDQAPLPRQREPRENSDFLRVIVLEMNMRRSGKMDAKAAGRARVWLPPRRCADVGGAPAVTGIVPMRWVGMTAEDLEDDD